MYVCGTDNRRIYTYDQVESSDELSNVELVEGSVLSNLMSLKRGSG